MVEQPILLMYGPQASGKDILTKALELLDSRFWQVTLHRGMNPDHLMEKSPSHYIYISVTEFESMLEKNEFLSFYEQGDSYYGISRKLLKDKLNEGCIPIIHTNGIAHQKKLEQEITGNVITILVWEPIERLEKRLHKIYPTKPLEVENRIRAAKEELAHLGTEDLSNTFKLVIQNDKSPVDAGLQLLYSLDDLPSMEEDISALKDYLEKINQ